MPHAYAKQGEVRPQLLHCLQRDARVHWPACVLCVGDDRVTPAGGSGAYGGRSRGVLEAQCIGGPWQLQQLLDRWVA
jgi:hypothetical protein